MTVKAKVAAKKTGRFAKFHRCICLDLRRFTFELWEINCLCGFSHIKFRTFSNKEQCYSKICRCLKESLPIIPVSKLNFIVTKIKIH